MQFLAKHRLIGDEMTSAALTEKADTRKPAYARFSRRLRAVFIDWIIFIVVVSGALFIAVAIESDKFSRGLGVVVAVVLLLYEPLLVWRTGSSVGHYLTNLRVVDDRTKGNVSFLKALARLLIKTILGWWSFITMATTHRHQALHDLLTSSTVQIRDPAKARSNHYAFERTELSDSSMPSRAWRTTIILAYLLLSFVLVVVAVNGLIIGGGISRASVLQNRCSSSEDMLFTLISLIWIAFCGLVIVQGWRGRIPGCRARQVG
jgi:uncharacterized RDD family membrane protein YckC